MAVRLRPRNAEELASDADFADCVELQPEVFMILYSSTFCTLISNYTYRWPDLIANNVFGFNSAKEIKT